MMFCIECGKKLLDDDKFCGKCGNKVESHIAQKAESQRNAPCLAAQTNDKNLSADNKHNENHYRKKSMIIITTR